jgi:hypothetical protein
MSAHKHFVGTSPMLSAGSSTPATSAAQPFAWTKDADQLIAKNQTVKALMPRDTSFDPFRKPELSGFPV